MREVAGPDGERPCAGDRSLAAFPPAPVGPGGGQPLRQRVDLLLARPARAGRTRVLAVEGRSGAGKSTLAEALATARGLPLVRMDDLYPGWDGLLGGVEALVEWVLRPLSLGRPARWRRFDWTAGEYAEWHEEPAAGALLVEGVGCGAWSAAPFLSGLIWVKAPDDVRRSRALARDGDLYLPHWTRWADQEERFYATHDVRARADLTIVTG
ncbi:hypothetical protein [Microtetraspora niveoalba]|uniref:hypothetical protein n=1 Tax=Microtetraspora niveoalba TaxID=46175 RepID=UPI000A9F4E6D|nr:hypothetical protein [Microtetraspora niveoalba]